MIFYKESYSRYFLGEGTMQTKNFPQEVKKFEIESYKRPKNLKELKKSHVPFSGSPLKHPYDHKKVILVLTLIAAALFTTNLKVMTLLMRRNFPRL